MSRKYKFRDQDKMYFVSFAVVYWMDVFIRDEYRHVLLDSLRYCQKEKGLELYAWCIMSNHVHLIASASDNNLSDILRDFKKFTSRQIINSIKNNEMESWQKWMLEIFRKAGEVNIRNSEFQFWRQDNQPKEVYSPAFVFQKLSYIHNNPVEAGIVTKAEHYLYSSAMDYFQTKKCGLLEVVFI